MAARRGKPEPPGAPGAPHWGGAPSRPGPRPGQESGPAGSRPIGGTRAFRARVEGRVQGVGFRWSALTEARRLGLRGWVRNEDDGSVALHAEGEAPAVAEFRAWLEEGPPGARVDAVRVELLAPSGHYADFEVEY